MKKYLIIGVLMLTLVLSGATVVRAQTMTEVERQAIIRQLQEQIAILTAELNRVISSLGQTSTNTGDAGDNSGGALSIGDRVKVVLGDDDDTWIRVRETGSLSGRILGRVTAGYQGTVTSNPVSQGGHTWWQVNFDRAADGWISGQFLTRVGTITPPTQTQTPTVTVISPNGGKQYTIGSNLDIRWSGPSGYYNILLTDRNGFGKGTIANSVFLSNTGYRWNVRSLSEPSDRGTRTFFVVPGDYKILVVSQRVDNVVGYSISDSSDEYFTISDSQTVSDPIITSISPTSGPVGTVVRFTGGSGMVSPTVNLNGNITSATASTVVDSEYYVTFTVPSTLQPGLYNLSVTNNQASGGATSNSVPFTVTGTTPTVSVPTVSNVQIQNNQSQWVNRSTSKTVSWDYLISGVTLTSNLKFKVGLYSDLNGGIWGNNVLVPVSILGRANSQSVTVTPSIGSDWFNKDYYIRVRLVNSDGTDYRPYGVRIEARSNETFQVVASAPVVSVTLSASPTSIVSDGKPGVTTLSWSSMGATSCQFEKQILPTSGSMTVSLASTASYNISCTGPNGTASSNQVTVTYQSTGSIQLPTFGSNLITNGDFANGINNWSTQGVAQTSAGASGGALVIANDGSNSPKYYLYLQPVKVEPGSRYELSGTINAKLGEKLDGMAYNTCQMDLYIPNILDTNDIYLNQSGNQTFTRNYTVPSTASGTAYVRLLTGYALNGSCAYDNISLRKISGTVSEAEELNQMAGALAAIKALLDAWR